MAVSSLTAVVRCGQDALAHKVGSLEGENARLRGLIAPHVQALPTSVKAEVAAVGAGGGLASATVVGGGAMGGAAPVSEAVAVALPPQLAPPPGPLGAPLAMAGQETVALGQQMAGPPVPLVPPVGASGGGVYQELDGMLTDDGTREADV